MGEMVPDWAQMWGAKVKMPTDMRDDMLRDAIETCRDALDQCADFEGEGVFLVLHPMCVPLVSIIVVYSSTSVGNTFNQSEVDRNPMPPNS